jgi:hypothetical protein
MAAAVSNVCLIAPNECAAFVLLFLRGLERRRPVEAAALLGLRFLTTGFAFGFFLATGFFWEIVFFFAIYIIVNRKLKIANCFFI